MNCEITDRDNGFISSLSPRMRNKAVKFLSGCYQSKIPAHISWGIRTIEEQEKIVASGVVASPPGYSFHNYGLAFDIVFDNNPDKPGNQDPYKEPFPGSWESCAAIGLNCNLRPGFYFKGGRKDPPHYEDNVKASIIEIKDYYERYGQEALWKWLEDKEGTLNVNNSTN